MQGTHPRLHKRKSASAVYIAGIDLAGESEIVEEEVLTRPGRDATVITIAEIKTVTNSKNRISQPVIRVVEHYCWVGQKYPLLLNQMVDIVKTTWGCSRIVVDATGIGEPVASFLQQAIGSKVIPFKFSQKTKSEAGFELISAINSGRLKLYRQDGSEEYKQLLFELEKAKSVYRPNQTLNFFVDPSEGHDDYLMSLALVVEAARKYSPRMAKGTPSVE
jgi:hypothetical protein